MNKLFRKIVSIICLCVLLVGVFGVHTFAKSVTDSSSQLPFKYVITPKSPEWRNFTPLELKKKLNIAISDAENMDTETLLNIVLDYPFLGDIFAFDNQTNAIDFLAKQFNGLGVLLKRDDLKDALVNSHKGSTDTIIKLKKNKISNEERFKHKYRESLLAYPAVFNKLSTTEKEDIILNSEKVSTKINTKSITIEQSATFGAESVSIRSDGDIIRYGTVLTPMMTSVSVFEREDMSAADKAALNAYMDARYPNATRLRSATYKYNCHSYAWNSTSTSNVWWMNYPSAYMSDGGYNLVSINNASRGDKIYYPTSGLEHTGIISSVNGSNITVTSKWGAYGLYRHSSTYCPYTGGFILPNYWRFFLL